jgi:hypothetical protein
MRLRRFFQRACTQPKIAVGAALLAVILWTVAANVQKARTSGLYRARPAPSLTGLAREAKSKTARQRVALYLQMGERIAGARLWVGPEHARHRWFFERIGRVRVGRSERSLRLAPAAALPQTPLATGLLDQAEVLFYEDGSENYALVNGEHGALLVVPVTMAVAVERS